MACGQEKDDELPLTLTATGGSNSTGNANDKATADKLPWGRLIAQKLFLKSVDLVESFTFGRGEHCSVTVTASLNCSQNFIVKLSKLHFRIDKSEEDNLIYITDLSKNGTFVNKKLLGKGRRKILKNLDQIGVACSLSAIYVFLIQGSEVLDTFLPPELMDRFANVRGLGRGSCGEVRLVKDRNTFEQYAIKKIILSDSNSSLIHKINHPEKVYREISILKTLSHPCIINMFDIVRVDREVYLVLEYMSGGELTRRILNEPMTESIAKFYFMQMVLAIEYLHSKEIMHRDLKPENILLLDDREETLLKITDFGLSKVTNEDPASTRCGTLRYVAPEVINNRNQQYDKQVDVWSLGVILYFMMARDYPFRGDHDAAIVKNILRSNYDLSEGVWSDKDKEAVKDLIRRMLHLHPEDRIDTFEIFNHPWIANEINVKYRIRNLLGDVDVAMEHLFLGPPPKRFKSDSDSVSSDETNNVTFTGNNASYTSSSPTIWC